MPDSASPLFSVIIPCYNRAESLRKLLLSVDAQVHTDFEVIVVDDGSTDNFINVVEQFSQNKKISFVHQKNSERAAARNFGASLSKGKYLNFFDSDDCMYPHHLQTASDFIQQHNHCNFFHTGYNIVNELGNILITETGVIKRPENKLIVTNYLACNSVFIERHLFFETQFNPDRRLSSSEDWELWLRVISRAPLLCCPKITFEIRNHPGRSLSTISPDRIIERDTTMLTSLLNDQCFAKKFASKLKIFEADRYTFFSLCLIEINRTRESFNYLKRSFTTSLAVLSRKRFWACCKLISLNFVKGY